ncbi:MAG: hypothetical protein J1F37_03605 [Oscillospiraceae bacterium]|nr:hypothetical protein [Oscillospiraceae bacterium]
MTDAKTMAYINMYAVLGTLENLCELDPKAQEIISSLEKPVSLAFEVKDGPAATLTFSSKGCRMEDGVNNPDIKIPVSSCEKFNKIIDGEATPVPTKGIAKIGFLLKTFTALTDRLTELMRPSAEALADRDFFVLSTRLTFYTISVAISQIANQDAIGKASASYMVDGDISFGIKDCDTATIRVKNNHLVTIKKAPEKPRAIMSFADYDLASALFNGKVNALEELCKGTVEIHGMASMIDNMNRLLDRVGLYLA